MAFDPMLQSANEDIGFLGFDADLLAVFTQFLHVRFDRHQPIKVRLLWHCAAVMPWTVTL
jgi:hypothetical protein